MKYLFFDIECAACYGGGKLCEFGYVLTDDAFGVIEQQNIMINPKCAFDWYVIKQILNYPQSMYRASGAFDKAYPKIYSLLTAPDCTAVGHSVRSDCCHIGDDCMRYRLAVPSFKYIDIAELYKLHSEQTASTRLTAMCDQLGITVDGKAHSADTDALMTMRVLQSLCELFSCDIPALAQKRPSACGEFKNYEAAYRAKHALAEYLKDLAARGVHVADKADRQDIAEYMRTVRADGSIDAPKVRGKRYCISELYEYGHVHQTMQLIRLIKNAGGKVVQRPKTCNVFVSYAATAPDGTKLKSERGAIVNKLKRAGKSIAVIPMSALLSSLKVTEDDLLAPLPPTDPPADPPAAAKTVYSSGEANTALADVLRGAGIAAPDSAEGE